MVKVVRSEVSGLGFETPTGQFFALFPNGQNEKKPSQYGIERETRMSNKDNIYL
jgi:hypothetical protein